MPFSSAAIGSSNPSAPGASRRVAMCAATKSPSTMPRNGPMLAGIDDVRPRLARVYAPPTITDAEHDQAELGAPAQDRDHAVEVGTAGGNVGGTGTVVVVVVVVVDGVIAVAECSCT